MKKMTVLSPTERKAEMQELKIFLYASLIGAENEKLSEDIKQEMMRRYEECRKDNIDDVDWKYVLEPMGENANKYIKYMQS